MHIVNGDSAAGSFKQAFHIPVQELLIFRDVLSCGRLREYIDIEGWAKYRRDYWSTIYVKCELGSIDDITKAPNDFYNDFDIKRTKKVNLWIGCALSDQLLLVFLVKLFEVHGLDFSKLIVHQYVYMDDQSSTIAGLGMLSPEQIEAQKPEPLTFDSTQIDFCLDVWAAVTANNPEALVQILKSKQASLPLLSNALKSLLYRFPKLSSGLSYFDEVILKAAKDHGPNTARIIGHTLAHDMWPNKYPHALDLTGDTYLFARLKNMADANLKNPLLLLNTMNASLRETTTEITGFGLEVLEGKYNVVDVNGIDDWVGGIHLNTSRESVWFRNGDELVLQAI